MKLIKLTEFGGAEGFAVDASAYGVANGALRVKIVRGGCAGFGVQDGF